MSAQAKPWYEPAPLPLLLEPDPPDEDASRGCGWRLATGRSFRWLPARCHDDDAQGALIQHVIVRYHVHGVSRAKLCRELHYSTRQMQSWVSGRTMPAYAAPVLRLLAGLGVDVGARVCGRAESTPTERRQRALVAAYAGLLGKAAALLDGDDRPEAERLRTLLRVLAAGREPLGPTP